MKTFFYDQYTELPYMTVNGTAMVWVTVTLGGRQRTCFLPVMDHRNKPIQTPDAFQVNTAIMRCMTKCLSLFGLGLYIYAGEDLPEGEEEKPEPKKPEPKPEAKPLVSTDWKLNVGKGEDRAWADKVSVEAAKLLDQTKTKADVMEVFKVNRTVFDQMKLADEEIYKQVMAVFKDMKEKRE